MARLSLQDLQNLAASVGFPDPALAAAVAEAESGGDSNAYGDAQYGGSVGLWQVNLPSHPNFDPQSLYDPTYNAKAAYAISSGGTNWNPWTTYRTGAYLKWYNPAQPTPAAPAAASSNVALGVAVLAGIALLSYFGYQAAERRGYV
jgi:hypothetical protein